MEQRRTDRQRSVKKKKAFQLKHLINLFYRLLLFVMIFVLLQSVIKNIWVAKLLADNQKKVHAMKIEKEALDKQIQQTKTDFFVEKMAREKLDMLKSGEIILKLQSEK